MKIADKNLKLLIVLNLNNSGIIEQEVKQENFDEFKT